MTEAFVLSLAQNAITITLLLAAPVLLTSLIIGSLISMIQAATSINEVTLSFIPKVLGIVIIMVVLGSWMLQQLMTFTSNLFSSLPNLVH
jgi:flagellar biosynthetic protein FliQ